MERPFGSYEKASEAVLPRLLESLGSVQQIQHQRENDERERDPLGHLRQSTVKRFRLTLGEESLRAAGDSAGQTGAFSGLEQHDDDQEDTGEELDDGESKNKTVHEIQSFLF